MSNWTKLGQHGELENRSSRWDHREEPRKRAWTSEEGYKSPNLPFSSCVTYSNSGGLPSYTSWTSQFNSRNPRKRKRELKGKNAFNERYNDKPTVSFSKWLSQRNRNTDQRTLPSSAEISGCSSNQEIPVIMFIFFPHTSHLANCKSTALSDVWLKK